jgi:hypothetical protein
MYKGTPNINNNKLYCTEKLSGTGIHKLYKASQMPEVRTKKCQENPVFSG